MQRDVLNISLQDLEVDNYHFLLLARKITLIVSKMLSFTTPSSTPD